MIDITKHDSEKEWEADDRKYGRIDFLVSWDAVSVHNQLEDFHEFIVVEFSRPD